MIFRSLLCLVILTSIFISTFHFHIDENYHADHNHGKSYESECNICNHNIVKRTLDFTINQPTYFTRMFMLECPPSTPELIFLISDLNARSPPYLIT